MRRALALLVLPGLLAGAIAGPVSAAASPEEAVGGMLEAVVAKDWERLSAHVCAENAEEVRAAFDLSRQAGLEGFDPDALLAAFTITLDDLAITLASSEATSAVVDVTGTMTLALDPVFFRAAMVGYLDAAGATYTEELLDQAVDEAVAAAGVPQSLDGPVDVVLEDGEWLVCGDLALIADAEAAGDDLDAEDTCPALLPLAEVNTLGYAYVAASGDVSSCTYTSDPVNDPGTAMLAVYLDEGSTIAMLAPLFADAETITVDGADALWVPSIGALHVERAAGGLLVAQGFIFGVDAPADMQAYLIGIATATLAHIGG